MTGYENTADASRNVSKRIFHGSAQVFFDTTVACRRKCNAFGRSIGWSLQLNVKNVFDNDAFVRLKVSPAGELLSYRFNPPREWILTSRFSF